MDLLQYLFVLLLSGTGVTDTLKTSLDPSLEICILWGGGGVNKLLLRGINSLSVPTTPRIPGLEQTQPMRTGEKR